MSNNKHSSKNPIINIKPCYRCITANNSLCRSIRKNHLECTKYFIKNKNILHRRDKKRNWTPLMFAFFYQNIYYLQILLAAGANINQTDSMNRPLLVWAFSGFKTKNKNMKKTIAFLLKIPIDFNLELNTQISFILFSTQN